MIALHRLPMEAVYCIAMHAVDRSAMEAVYRNIRRQWRRWIAFQCMASMDRQWPRPIAIYVGDECISSIADGGGPLHCNACGRSIGNGGGLSQYPLAMEAVNCIAMHGLDKSPMKAVYCNICRQWMRSIDQQWRRSIAISVGNGGGGLHCNAWTP